MPLSEIDGTLLGSLAGSIRNAASVSRNYDQSDQEADQWSQELRLSSELDGPLNFQLGVFYLDADDDTNYYVVTSELDYWAQVTRAYSPFVSSAPPYYINATPVASLESGAVFGELHWDLSERFKWTAGLRYTRDEKGIKDRQMLFSVPVLTPPSATQFNDFRTDTTTFEELTGRFGFDVKPGWFDDSTLYALYSRGYKAGGFNPPLDRSLPQFAGTPEVYEPEFIDAFEIGSKNLLADGRVQANLTAFYYQYDALQVSKIVARVNRGAACAKGASMRQLCADNPRRLTKPQYRAPGSSDWEPVEWDWALEEIAKKIKATRDANWMATDEDKVCNRTEAVACLGGAALDNEECYLLSKMMRGLGLVYLEHQARI